MSLKPDFKHVWRGVSSLASAAAGRVKGAR